MTETMRLGVCYYPEHWPEENWDKDARRMVAMGLSRVRIGEFAWSRIEPSPGQYDWDWLDRAVETLHRHGLGIIMGTPTATPPKWLVDQMPDMVAIDEQGRPRTFGSRRHYCFSHAGYAKAAERIVEAMAERYGAHPAIVAWQTDNEYGCHNTTQSFSEAAQHAFRKYLAGRYATIDALNTAWGNVFWSMEYRSFDEIDLPNLCVTEPNPAHVLDFRRFSSDQVVAFNRMQCNILRLHSAGRDVVHNFMGFYTEFDHHAVGADLDVATWDSYPLGFLEQFWFSQDEKNAFVRQGHPDIAAFHHDLYRGCTAQGRWWVMEQQPGPVNWARFNPAPLPGMVRLWTLEAMAHGAELVSYFRWRQAPFAQEQMHAGLLRPDSVDDVGAHEARQVASEIAQIGAAGSPPKSVALVFSYDSDWVTDIQPQGRSFSALRLAFEFYSGLRQLGLDVDIVAPGTALNGYQMVVIPTMPILPDGFVDQLAAFSGPVVIGTRTGSKTKAFNIPSDLPPGPLQSLIPIKVTRVESLREGVFEHGDDFVISHWIEHIETKLSPDVCLQNGQGVVYSNGPVRYVAAWPDAALLQKILGAAVREAGLETINLAGKALRVRRTQDLCFAFNYGADACTLNFVDGADFVLGSPHLEPAGVAIWRKS